MCNQAHDRVHVLLALGASPGQYADCLSLQRICYFISDIMDLDSAISFRTLWTIFWLAKTSNKPISLTTWLAVNPLT